RVSVKMWLAIITEPGLNGLYVVPGSHRKQWRVAHTTGADGYARPALDEALGDYAPQLIAAAPGQAILFNEKLLHGGAPNAGATCRVSVEITFILQRSAITG
ncbi:MAG TPA: phytanoyl-CoA dioxygenase family protein, partial [Herbaspirillum sp.]|nr:phytanoyl-CoA dioxygenase family protein [Herbaspirillum sp.]